MLRDTKILFYTPRIYFIHCGNQIYSILKTARGGMEVHPRLHQKTFGGVSASPTIPERPARN
jgi:hypothetical protein